MQKSFSNSSTRSSKALLAVACALAIALGACGGGGGGGGTPPPPPGGGGSQDVCTGTGAEADGQDFQPARPPASNDLASRKAERVDGNPRGRLFDALWLNKSRADRIRRPATLTGGRDAVDVGEIAVIQDEGDLLESPNAYDLRNLGLRFTRNSAGGYDVRRIDSGFRTGLGTRFTLTDDDSVPLNVAFGVPLLRADADDRVRQLRRQRDFRSRRSREHRPQRGEAAHRTSAHRRRSLPTSTRRTGGRVFGNAAADQYTVTWCGVRGFESTRTTNAQADPASRRHDRDEVRRSDARRGGRRASRRDGREILRRST